jgi:chlorophyllide a reductase subunit Z
VGQQPVLVQISAARRLRDHAERLARMSGVEQVGASHVEAAGREMGWEVTA